MLLCLSVKLKITTGFFSVGECRNNFVSGFTHVFIGCLDDEMKKLIYQ